jgi:hypothetical protein
MSFHRLLAPALLLALSACGGLSNAPPPVVQSATEVSKSVEQDGKFISLVGPRRPHAEPFLGVPGTNYYALRSWIDTRNGETAHQLYVEDSYFGDKRNWNEARDQAGAALRFVPISLNEITCGAGCSYAEEFAAVLPEALLRTNPQGLSVMFTAKSGEKKTIAVPAELIQKQLAAIDATRAPLPKTAAAAAAPSTPSPR